MLLFPRKPGCKCPTGEGMVLLLDTAAENRPLVRISTRTRARLLDPFSGPIQDPFSINKKSKDQKS